MSEGSAGDGAEGGSERTILFADIVDSTGLYREYGDERARKIILACTDQIAEISRESGGTVIERIGDEVLCAFDKPDAAGHAAAVMHKRLDNGPGDLTGSRPPRLRVGFEHGPTIHTAEGVFGTTVHTAARLASLAKASQTLTTRESLDLMHPVFQRVSRFFDRVVFKGYQGVRDVYEVVWDSSATVTLAGPTRREPSESAVLEISRGGQTWQVDAQTPRLDIGRHPACGVQVAGAAVSKLHARLVWDRGRVRLEDLSTNGTYVHQDGEKTIFLHHESLTLAGEGSVTLGSEAPDVLETRLTFRCSRCGGASSSPPS